jgi:hypothetical protein
VLDWLFGFEQHEMLLDRYGLEIRLKSPKVIAAELVKQKVLHGALLRTGGSAKNSQLSVPEGRYPTVSTW